MSSSKPTPISKKTSSHLQRLELCNELNSQHFLSAAYLNGDQLIIDHLLNFRDELLRENFVRCCRQFASNIEHEIDKIDANNECILLSGQTEPEDESSQ